MLNFFSNAKREFKLNIPNYAGLSFISALSLTIAGLGIADQLFAEGDVFSPDSTKDRNIYIIAGVISIFASVAHSIYYLNTAAKARVEGIHQEERLEIIVVK